MKLEEKTYERIGKKIDHLYEVHDPFQSEENRQAFRNALIETFEEEGVSEEDWMSELSKRILDKELP